MSVFVIRIAVYCSARTVVVMARRASCHLEPSVPQVDAVTWTHVR